MADFTDWLARTFFISEEQEQTSAQVAAAQQAILDRQRDEGKVGAVKYLKLSGEIADTGTQYFDEQLGKKGLAGVPSLIPWWVYLLVIVGLAFYFWPLLRPFVSKFTKRL